MNKSIRFAWILRASVAGFALGGLLLLSGQAQAQSPTPDGASPSPSAPPAASPPPSSPPPSSPPPSAPPPSPEPSSPPSAAPAPPPPSPGAGPGTPTRTPFRYAGPLKFSVGFSVGVVPPHDDHIWANHPDRDGWGIEWSFKAGPMAGFTLNFWPRPNILVRAYFDYLYLHSQTTDAEHHLMSTGGRFLYVFRIGRVFQIRLGIGIGVNVMKSTVLDYWDYGVAVGINPSMSLEFAFGVGSSMAVVLGYKFISMPWCEGKKVTWPPISMLYVSLEFGR